MPVLSKNEKVFDHYNELPPEVRMMVVDEMVPDDRCRFRRCSKLSQKEALSSKNYLYGLRFAVSESSIDIYFAHKKVKYFHIDYTMKFNDKHVKCFNSKEKELWKKDLENCTDWIQQAVEYCKTLLRLHQRSIRDLTFLYMDIELANYSFGVEHLKSFKNLEYLTIFEKVDVVQFLYKTRRPLKSLFCGSEYPGEYDTSEIIEKVCQISEYVGMSDLKLNEEQFSKLSASVVSISIGYLTEIDIYNFIESWRNGKIGKKVEKYTWNLEGSSFDVIELFRLLGLRYDDNKWLNIAHIKHSEDADKRAKLKYYGNGGSFKYSGHHDQELIFEVCEKC